MRPGKPRAPNWTGRGCVSGTSPPRGRASFWYCLGSMSMPASRPGSPWSISRSMDCRRSNSNDHRWRARRGMRTPGTNRLARSSPRRPAQYGSRNGRSCGGRRAGTRVPPGRSFRQGEPEIIADDGDGAPVDGGAAMAGPGRARARAHPAQAHRGGSDRGNGGDRTHSRSPGGGPDTGTGSHGGERSPPWD